MGILLILLAFIAIIAIHELGHTLACIWCGVGVTEFAIGFGPTLYTWHTKRFPVHFKVFFLLGGYMRPKSKKDIKTLETEGKFLEDVGLPQQTLIFLAGILANLLTAIVVRTLIFWFAPTDLIMHYGPITLRMLECPDPWYLAPFYATKLVFAYFFKFIFIVVGAIGIMVAHIVQFTPIENGGIIAMGSAMQSVTENSPSTTSSLWSIVALFYYFSTLIAAFNVIPFLPFDGGQVVRATLTRIFGEGKVTKYTTTALVIVGLGIIAVIGLIIIISDLSAIWQLFTR